MTHTECGRCEWVGEHVLALLAHLDEAHGGRPPVRAYVMVPEGPAPVPGLPLRQKRRCVGCGEQRYVRVDGSCWCWDCLEWVEAAA